MDDKQRQAKNVFMMMERDGKPYWLRIGAGFVNRDGSINLRLDAAPLASRMLQIRDAVPAPATLPEQLSLS